MLILDEPTARADAAGAGRALFGVLSRLAAEGRTVLFVTHKLHEAIAITDRVTILRDGSHRREPTDRQDRRSARSCAR